MAIMDYYGMELLTEIQSVYSQRYKLAVERGFDKPGSKYKWLYDELQYRLRFLRQIILFSEALAQFIRPGSEEDAVRYVVRYVSGFFNDENCCVTEHEGGRHPFFNDENGYYIDFKEALDRVDANYDLTIHPLLLVDLTECAVRAARLHLQIREQQYHAIDRDKFDTLMQMCDQLPASA